MESNGKIGYSAAENNVMNMKPGPLERTWLWKLRNVPPIIFRLVLFSLPIFFLGLSWVIDIGSIDKMDLRSNMLISRGFTALCIIWVIDCIVRIKGFTNIKALFIYETVKAIGIIFCIALITIVVITMGYYDTPVWYFLSPIGLGTISPIRKLKHLCEIINDYKIIEVNNLNSILISVYQYSLDIPSGYMFSYAVNLNYEFVVNGKTYKYTDILNNIIRHKFADYRNGKPLKIIYSIKNPKFNIIFQD